MTLILKRRHTSLTFHTTKSIIIIIFVGKIYFVYVHLRLFCVRLVRCVLDATGMLPSVDDVYVHCGPPPSTIWGMTIMSQFLPASDSTLFLHFILEQQLQRIFILSEFWSMRRSFCLVLPREELKFFRRALNVTGVSFEIILSPKVMRCEIFGFLLWETCDDLHCNRNKYVFVSFHFFSSSF